MYNNQQLLPFSTAVAASATSSTVVASAFPVLSGTIDSNSVNVASLISVLLSQQQQRQNGVYMHQ
jgi:hypothetical protein